MILANLDNINSFQNTLEMPRQTIASPGIQIDYKFNYFVLVLITYS